jgi:hypothetical protein
MVFRSNPWSRIPADMLTYLSRHSRWLFAFAFTSTLAAQTAILQPLAEKPVPGASVKLKTDFYVPATPGFNPLGLPAGQRCQSRDHRTFRRDRHF